MIRNFIFKYRFSYKPLLDHFKWEDKISKCVFECHGCGTILQHKNEDQIGFIKIEKLIQKLMANFNLINKNQLSENVNEILQNNQLSQQQPQLSNLDDLQELDAILDQTSLKGVQHDKNLVCQRCFQFKQNKSSNLSINQYLDPKKLVNDIFIKIHSRSMIVLLIDVFDFQVSINNYILKQVQNKKCDITIIVNKIDVLPSDTDIIQLKSFIKQKLKQLIPEANDKIFFVSSKSGQGFDKLIKYFEELKKIHQQDDQWNKKIFVMGNTNTGKSSFINKLIDLRTQNSHTHPKFILEPEQQQLTMSPFPHTTLDLVKIKHLNLGFSFYDTPGIPEPSQIAYHLEHSNDASLLLVTKKITPNIVNVRQGDTLFIGGLVRIDLIDGHNLDFYISCSHNVSIHRTNTQKANQLYIKQYNQLLKPVYNQDIKKVVFEKFDIEIECDTQGQAKDEIEIFGLGVIGFRSNRNFLQKTKIQIFVKKGVGFTLRRNCIKNQIEEKRNKIQSKLVFKTRQNRKKI